MSTLSGNATKGEKGKKFQQLKIFLPSGSKSAEPEQQPNKSSAQRIQHGMTSLGKVPTARRPTNLPSEKSEQSGNDPSVNLVPSGGPGWGNKANETGPTTSSAPNANPPTSVSVNSTSMPGTSQPVQHVQHYPPTPRMPPMATVPGHVPVHHGHPDAKTWARMTLGGDSQAGNLFTPQSPLFHHEFPSLSSNAETTTASSTHATATVTQKPATNSAADTQYGPGPSLRPQTVSWMSGSRPQGSMGPAAGNLPVSAPAPVRPTFPPQIGPDGARNNLAPSGVGVVPAGPYHPPVMSDKIPPQYSALMPPFMLGNSYPGAFPPGVGPRPPYRPYISSGQHGPAERYIQPPTSGANSNKRSYDDEDVKIRSIIKEEDLNEMVNIGHEIGWAGHEDIDYNVKLKFSDDEDDDKNKEGRSKTRNKTHQASKPTDKPSAKKESDKENDPRNMMENLKDREKLYPTEVRNVWQVRKTMVAAAAAARYQIAPTGRMGEDEEDLQERRKQKKDEIDAIIQRAKERREEEERRYQEQLQHAANLKLRKLDERILAEQRKLENKDSHHSDIDMLPEWEKEKIRAQSNQNNEESKKVQTATPVPVVKDASEFRALTQLGDRSVFTKKERESANSNYSRSFTNNVPPRFQNLNRQNSSGSTSNSTSSQNLETRKNSLSQFSNKSNSPSFSSVRHMRLDSDSLSDKDRDWNQEDVRKERFISDDRPSERFQRDGNHSRDYNYERESDDDRKFSKEYDSDSKRKFYDKGDYSSDSYNREYDRDSSYSVKIERKNSESERSDKSRDYDGRRYSENEGREKTPPTSWRQHDDSSSEKSRQHFVPRSPRNFSDNESHERKKSRDEGSYEKTNFNNERDREYHRKEIPSRQPKELDREKEQDYREMFVDHKNMDNSEVKRSLEGDKREKDSERKSPSTHDDRPSRNDLRDARYSRESRESLRDDTYTIQEERSFSWVNETEVVEEKPVLRREHYREERGGDRYSHAQRHPPGPITREKLEAKELEDSKRNLTALVRSDKKADAKRSEAEDKKEKEKTDAANSESASNSSHSHKQEEPVKSVWNKDDKKDKESKSSTATGEAATDNKENKEKDDAKESSKSTSKHDEQSTKNHEDKRSDRSKNKNERAPKRDIRNNWARHPVYRGNPYGGRLEPKSLRQGRPLGKASSRRDSKFSESDYSDEISGSGREDRMSRNDRDDRPMKSKRYDRDDRNMDYRMDREYMGGGGRGRMRDYAYNKPSHRGRGGFRGSVGVGKRMDGYGPPPSKSPFGSQGGYPEERRMKGSRDSNNSQQEHHNASEKRESHSYDKSETADSKSSTSSRQQNDNDKNWKKNDNVQDNKSTVSSPTSVQTTEANEESFATASEGSDSEDNVQLVKNKPSFTGTKRQATVVAAKPQRRNYRSTSRKRPEGRRTAPLYSSRKDSGSYSSGKRSTAGGSSGKSSMSNKENEKYSNETNSENSYAKESDVKSVEKPRREYGDSQTKKSVKSRNSSNSRKSTRTGVVSSGRSKNAEVPARGLGKPKKNYDSKNFSDRKESKVDIPVPLFKELGPPIPAPPPTVNAWDKPITGALRTGSPSINAATSVTVSTSSVSVSATNNSTTVVKEKSVIQITEQHTESSPQSDLSPSSSVSTAEKVTTKVLENLDGSSPPVQTIIFENTNFKSGPSELNSKSKYTSQLKSHRYEKDMKLESLNSECANVSNFSANSSNSELPNNKHDALQMSLSFTKNEDASDMKLEFFDSEISKLTEDNKSAKTMELTHAIPIMQSSTAADLNLKIASVKKVWDGSFPEHFDDKYDGVMVNPGTSFPQPFSCHGSDSTNGPCYVNAHVDSAGHVQIDEVSGLGHNEVVYSPVSQIQGVNSSYGSAVNCQTVVIKNDSTSSSSNVCKVKPQPQGTNIPIVAQQSVGMSATLVSQPPPMSSPSYTFSCSTPQPNLGNNTVSATALAQMNYQYSSMPPVPSPPVLYNSSQTAAAPPTGLYQTYQIDNTQVAARSQFGQYPSYGLSGAIGQTSAFNQQSLFVQPPPNAPPPEIYPAAMTGFRLQPQPFGNTQQITSPSTVLISSTSNSLMSATVKPSNQQIGAIGTKTGFTTAQTSQQVFIPFEQASQILPPNFMAGNQLLQRPAGSVLPAASLQASTSFYNTGSGAGQTGFYQPGTNSHLQPQPGTAIGLTTFNAQSATASLGPAAIQNFGSQLTQQFRSAQATSYLKGSGNPCNIPSDFGNGKAIALSNQHDQLFPAGNQMSSTKARIPSGGKSVQNVQQAMGQHTMPPNSYNYPPANQMRNNGGASKGSQYPHPIQRPVSQGNNSNRSGNANSSSASHRMPVRNNSHQLVNNIQQQPPSSVYYTPSSGYSTGSSKLETSQLDSKSESNSDSKLADSIKTINSKNVTVSSSEKTAATNE